jgi:uncharacterized membrane protein YsdA (DUF1294 family)
MPRLGWTFILVAGILTTLVAWMLTLTTLPLPAAAPLALNLVTVLGYGYDKHQARRGRLRVPEAALHVLAAIGGTPGAFAGQRLFHHKTHDQRFQIIFWLIVTAQVAALVTVTYLKRR